MASQAGQLDGRAVRAWTCHGLRDWEGINWEEIDKASLGFEGLDLEGLGWKGHPPCFVGGVFRRFISGIGRAPIWRATPMLCADFCLG